jgi:phosphoribosylanthranilate isomerase
VIVKICGITRPEDAVAAIRAGADWLGLNFWPTSKRYLTLAQASDVVHAARQERPEVGIVGVFVDQPLGEVTGVLSSLELDRAQLHGDEPPDFVRRLGDRAIKALAMAEEAQLDELAEYDCPVVLVDTPSPGRGGSGIVGDWSVAQAAAALRKVILAGGLTPDNVADAIAAVQPWGVDVASGVESAPGVKDAELIASFVARARAAAARLGARS